jgi:3-oxoacyl-[acyl-carrier-protein] synthase II
MTYTKKIAITGLGCCCSAGQNVSSVWQSVKSNRVNCLPGASDFFQPHKASPLFAVNCEDITTHCPPAFFERMNSNSLQGLNRTTALALAAATEALNHAQISLDSLTQLRVGVALGTTVGCTFHNEPYYIQWKKGGGPEWRGL